MLTVLTIALPSHMQRIEAFWFSETLVHRLVDKPFSGNRNAWYCI